MIMFLSTLLSLAAVEGVVIATESAEAVEREVIALVGIVSHLEAVAQVKLV